MTEVDLDVDVVLSVREAAKAFGDVAALDGLSLEVRRGERLGLLGPNGAGKTTLIRAAAGRLDLDRGEIALFGDVPRRGRPSPQIGVVPQGLALFPRLTARENIAAFGRFQGLTGAELRERVAWCLEWTGLTDRADEPVNRLSEGMKRRANVAAGVVHAPDLILLDEPTAGVDPQSRERLYEMLDVLRADGGTVLLATHHIEEVEHRCDRVAILDAGRLAAIGTRRELLAGTLGLGSRLVVRLTAPTARAPDGFVTGSDPRLLVRTLVDVAVELAEAVRQLDDAGLSVADIEVARPRLQEVFLHLTGRGLRE